MSDRTALLTENDDDGGGAPPGGIVAPQRPGISLDLPPLLPQQRSKEPLQKREREAAQQQQGDDVEYDIVDTEAQPPARPLSSATEGGEQLRGDEGQGAEGEGSQAGEQERGRNWQRKQEQKQRRREHFGRTQAELEAARAEIAQLRDQVNSFAPRFNEIDQQRLNERRAQIDHEINAQAQTALAAGKKFAAAVRSADDDDAITAAMQERDSAIIRGQELQAQKRLLSAGYVLDENGIPKPVQPPRQAAPEQQIGQPQPPRQRMDPIVVESVQDFAERHPWFQSGDERDLEDTQKVLDLDWAVSRRFDPKTQAYWDRLDELVEAALPHRFARRQSNGNGAYQNGNGNGAYPPANGGDQPPQRRQQPPVERRGPMVGGPSERGAPPGRQQVFLTPGRKEAMIQKGILERDGTTIVDKERFKRQVRYFADYDRENGPPPR